MNQNPNPYEATNYGSNQPGGNNPNNPNNPYEQYDPTQRAEPYQQQQPPYAPPPSSQGSSGSYPPPQYPPQQPGAAPNPYSYPNPPSAPPPAYNQAGTYTPTPPPPTTPRRSSTGRILIIALVILVVLAGISVALKQDAGEVEGTLTGVSKSISAALMQDASSLRLSGVPNSIDTLSPNNRFVKAINTVPITPGIPYHSIIGDRGKGGNKDRTPPVSSDGVVPYWSSHLEGANSELIVPSNHSAHQNPHAIQEVGRILRANVHE